MELPPINQRIRELVYEFTNGSVRKFSLDIGHSSQKINRLFNIDPRSEKYPEPSLEIVKAIASKYSTVNFQWLNFGEGEMLKKAAQSENTIEKNNLEHGVPYFDIDISATMAESFSDIAEAPEFYVDFKPFNDCTVYLPVFGESMYPVISSGEIVALKKIDNPEYIQYGEVHMVITNAESNNMRTLKIIRKHENDDLIILKPVNPSFDELVIPRRTIISLYIMKGKITRKQL